MWVSKRGPGRGPRARFLPGCLVVSLILSVAATVLVNVLIRLL